MEPDNEEGFGKNKEEELKFEDSTNVVNYKGSLKDQQAGFRHRITSKRGLATPEILKIVDISDLRTPSVDQRAKLAALEDQIAGILQKEAASRTEEDYAVLEKYVGDTASLRSLKSEYDEKVSRKFLQIFTLHVVNQDENITKYSIS